MPQKNYDIFISYRSLQRPWVETLARNLQTQGYSIFLDVWELVAGQNFTREIFNALDNSRCALLIATPESANSGWVQDEYEYMMNLSKNKQGFYWIPVVLGEYPDFPFLSNTHAVDFADSQAEHYRTAFQQLLCAIEKKPPGDQPYFSGSLQFPQVEPSQARPLVETERSFIESIFNYLDASMPVMLLAQMDANTQHYARAVKQFAEQHYGADNILHIFPPASSRADSVACFSRMAKQCKFPVSIQDSWEWADLLRDRLAYGEPLLLLVTGFENGPDNARAELAGELRSLLQQHPQELKLLIMGGKRLAELKYKDGKMSLLNTLTEIRLPETSQQDLQEIYLKRYPQLNLEEDELQQILEFTGRHPRLIEASLQALQTHQQNWQKHIKNSLLPSQLFTQFRDDSDHTPLCNMLKQNQLGRYEAWPQDDLLRRLYWANLISHADGKFVWRCEFICEMGKEILGC